jgi:hypothetical protein
LVTQELLKFSQLNVEKGWDFLVTIPLELKQEIRDLKQFLQPELGRPFLTKPMHFLHSDSSTWAWGGVDSTEKVFIQEYWREKNVLHINAKELMAAVATIKAFAKPGEVVSLNVDNQVALSYLTKWGGRKEYLNKILQPLFQWCWTNKIQIHAQWVPSEKMLADPLTRWSQDRGDYTFAHCCSKNF